MGTGLERRDSCTEQPREGTQRLHRRNSWWLYSACCYRCWKTSAVCHLLVLWRLQAVQSFTGARSKAGPSPSPISHRFPPAPLCLIGWMPQSVSFQKRGINTERWRLSRHNKAWKTHRKCHNSFRVRFKARSTAVKGFSQQKIRLVGDFFQ